MQPGREAEEPRVARQEVDLWHRCRLSEWLRAGSSHPRCRDAGQLPPRRGRVQRRYGSPEWVRSGTHWYWKR